MAAGRSVLGLLLTHAVAAASHATREAFINTHRTTHALRITILQITIIVYSSSINTFLYWFLPCCPGVWAGLQPETKAARSLSAAIYIRSKPHPEHMPRTECDVVQSHAVVAIKNNRDHHRACSLHLAFHDHAEIVLPSRYKFR